MGGKIFFSTLTGAKLIPISRKLYIIGVPSTIPYASGHGRRIVLPSEAAWDLQVPSLYMASNIANAVESRKAGSDYAE